MRSRKMRMGLSDRIFYICPTAAAVAALIMVLYPMYFIVIASFSNSTMVNQGMVTLIPRGINFYGYRKILERSDLWLGYRNTLFYTVVGTMLNLAVTLPAAYVLAQKKFKARRVVMTIFVITMYFGGGMVPTYMLVKSLHLTNSILTMIIMGAVSVYNVIIARTFFESSIPTELQEAAELDGCSHFRYFTSIVLPLSKAVISVITLYYAVGHWNDFFTALLYLNKDEYQPLQTILRNILISNQAMAGTTGAGEGSCAQQFADQIKFAVIIVSTVPVLCIYPFIQKYFEKGVMIGAVKG
ncbi:MAG TPA: sugar ABC transporter permease [Lachnospiraceae bacterium]|nr:sugar ABC transporter permease [Lachnospiraceae bacterium]